MQKVPNLWRPINMNSVIDLFYVQVQYIYKNQKQFSVRMT